MCGDKDSIDANEFDRALAKVGVYASKMTMKLDPPLVIKDGEYVPVDPNEDWEVIGVRVEDHAEKRA